MSEKLTLFDRFGGTRKMADALGEPPSTVQSWKTAGRIPAFKQPDVLAKGRELGLDITADDIIFPLGRENIAEGHDASATKCGEIIGNAESLADNLAGNIGGAIQLIDEKGEADSLGPFSMGSPPTCSTTGGPSNMPAVNPISSGNMASEQQPSLNLSSPSKAA